MNLAAQSLFTPVFCTCLELFRFSATLISRDCSRPRGNVVSCASRGFLVGTNCPASEESIAARQLDLDDFIPVYHPRFHKMRHSWRGEMCSRASRGASERNFSLPDADLDPAAVRSGPESILNAPENIHCSKWRRGRVPPWRRSQTAKSSWELWRRPLALAAEKKSAPEDFKALRRPDLR